MKDYAIKMGRRVLNWTSPYDYLEPQADGVGPQGVFSSPQEALDSPVDSQPLEALAAEAGSIVVVVPDASRSWQRASLMAQAVRDRIASATDRPVQWIVAVGQHRPALQSDLALLLGEAAKPGDSWSSHDCDSAVDTGLRTPTGTPVTLNPQVLAADLLVLLGGVTYHSMAGFSGGRKSLIPGVSGRQSIVKNHCHCIKDGQVNPDVGNGRLEGNPMAEDMLVYAKLALEGRNVFLLNTIADSQGQPAAWVAGHWLGAWETATQAAVSLQTLWLPGKVRRAVSSCGGYPYDLDLYQGTKALSAVWDLLEPGAPVVLVADLEEGLGPGNFEEALRRSLVDSDSVMKELEETFTIPGYIAVKTVLDHQIHPCALVTSREDVPFPGPVFQDMASADRWLQDISGLQGLSALIPSGNAVQVFAR